MIPPPPAGAETPVPSGNPSELSQHYCSFCQQPVQHVVLEKVNSLEQTTPGDVSWLLQCKACGAFSLQ